MLQRKQTIAATAKPCGAMESGNHSKNGASLKSLMSKRNLWMAVCLFLFSAMFGACKEEKEQELPAPTNVSAVQTDEGIKVSWNPVKGADNYVLRIGDGKGGEESYQTAECSFMYKPKQNGTYSFIIAGKNSKSLGRESSAEYCTFTAPKTDGGSDEENIVGTWFCEEEGITIILNSDGTYTYKERGYEEDGTYVFESSKLTLRDKDGDLSEQYVVKSVTGTTLEMTDLYENDWTFKKDGGANEDPGNTYGNADVVGTWKNATEGITITFNADSTYTYKEGSGYVEKGTYILHNSDLTLRDKDGKLSEQYVVKSITETTLKMTDLEELEWTFEKSEGSDEPEKTYGNADVVGHWVTRTSETRFTSFTFNADSTYSTSTGYNGEYILQDLKLTLYYTGGGVYKSFDIKSITDTVMVMLQDWGFEVKYEKRDAITVPTGLTARQTSGKQFNISWNPVKGADSYELEYNYKYTTTNNYGYISNKTFNKVVKNISNSNYLYTPEYTSGVTSFDFSVRAICNTPYEASNWSDTVSCSYIEPGGGTKSGLYMGIIGFNNGIYPPQPISLLTDYKNTYNTNTFTSFVNGLDKKDFTALFYAVDKAIAHMESATLPDDLDRVAIVTFTDGRDNASLSQKDAPDYLTREDYRDAVQGYILDTKIKGKTINAYSIGVGDVSMSDLKALADTVEKHVNKVENMDEVNVVFKDLADELYKESKTTTISLKTPTGYSPGTKLRYTFDDTTSAEKSKYYIEGEFYYHKKEDKAELRNVTYHEIESNSGNTTITQTLNSSGGVTFIFKDFKFTKDSITVDYENIRLWLYDSSEESWEKEVEFRPKENVSPVIERKSALVMLVLDCTESLNDGDFQKMKDAANSFIQILVGKDE